VLSLSGVARLRGSISVPQRDYSATSFASGIEYGVVSSCASGGTIIFMT